MFTRSPESGAFRQGEILSDVVQVHISLDSVNPQAEEIALEEKIHPQAIILTRTAIWTGISKQEIRTRRGTGSS